MQAFRDITSFSDEEADALIQERFARPITYLTSKSATYLLPDIKVRCDAVHATHTPPLALSHPHVFPAAAS